jgi:hypothetical protein
MYSKRIPSKIQLESILSGILHLIDLLFLHIDHDNKRGRPYVYSTGTMLRCFVVRIWLRIPSNNCLHHYFSADLSYNRKVMTVCGLDTLPDRRTFDRWFKSLPVQNMIGMIGARFVSDNLVDWTTVSVDSSMVRAMGHPLASLQHDTRNYTVFRNRH